MGFAVACQSARIRGPIITDRLARIAPHHVPVKIHQSLAGNRGAYSAHAVRRVTDRTGESIVDMLGVLQKTRIAHDHCQVVALPAKRIRPSSRKIRRRKQITNRTTRRRGGTDLISPLQDVRPF